MSGGEKGIERERWSLALYVLMKIRVHLCKGTALFRQDKGERSAAGDPGDPSHVALDVWFAVPTGCLSLRAWNHSSRMCPSVCPSV